MAKVHIEQYFVRENIIPQNLIISDAGNHLYRIGLHLSPFGAEKRKLFHNPLFVFTSFVIYICKSIIVLLIDKRRTEILILLGNLTHILNIKLVCNIAMTTFVALALVAQLINYSNYINGIPPIYLKM